MSAPEVGTTYRRTTTGERFRYIGTCPNGCHHLLDPMDAPDGAAVWAASPPVFHALFESVDLLALAEAVGVLADEGRRPGEQPQSEFSTGPTGHGPLWDDEHLADVFGLRDGAGGGS